MSADQRELLGEQMAALPTALEQLGKPRDAVTHETAAPPARRCLGADEDAAQLNQGWVE